MPSTISSPQVNASLSATIKGGSATQEIKANLSDSSGQTFGVGSSTNQVNKSYTAQLTINTSSATTLDLTTLTNALGEAVSFAQITAIKITNLSVTSGENITIGGGTNALFAALPFVLAATAAGGSTLLLATPITVDSTHKILQLAAAAGSAVQVTVTLFGH